MIFIELKGTKHLKGRKISKFYELKVNNSYFLDVIIRSVEKFDSISNKIICDR